MAVLKKIEQELKAIGVLALYFSVWAGFLVALKKLILAEYHIAYTGLSMALVGVLVLSKVVLLMEHVSLGAWVRRQPVIVDVFLRTLLYSAGVALVLILEKTIDGRHEYGGVFNAAVALFKKEGIQHVLANIICVSAALVVYNALNAVREHLGGGGLRRVFLSPRSSVETPGEK